MPPNYEHFVLINKVILCKAAQSINICMSQKFINCMIIEFDWILIGLLQFFMLSIVPLLKIKEKELIEIGERVLFQFSAESYTIPLKLRLSFK